jgi:hypothetical protein
MKNKMYNRFRKTVSTVRKSHSRMLAACWRRNPAQLASSRRGAGSIPASRQDRPDRARRDPDAEPDQLPLDTPVSPARVLARKPHHQLTQLDGRARATRRPVGVRPAPRHQLPMPTQKRRRCDEEGRPPLSRQHPAERGKQSPIGRTEPRTSDLTLQYAKLVAQQQVSRPGESRPRALSDPDVSLSTHPAPIIQPWAARPGASGQRGLALAVRGVPRTSVLVRRGRAAACISSWPNERGSR